MLVSIIIPTFNSLSRLQQALNSIEIIDYPVDSFEVVVVDDGSTDQTMAFLSNYAKSTSLTFQFFHQVNRGPAAARNLAIKHARGDYLLSIDSDCYVDSKIISEYLKHFPCERLAGVGGDVLPDDHNHITRYLDYRGVWRPGAYKDEIMYLVTANAFFCKKAILDVGGFDEIFRRPGGEEPEMCHRLRKKGYFFLYEKNAKVVHAHRTSLKGMLKMFKTHGTGSRIGSDKWAELRWPIRYTVESVLGRFTMEFAKKAFKSQSVADAAYYTFLEYMRTLAFFYGYHTGTRRIDRK